MSCVILVENKTLRHSLVKSKHKQLSASGNQDFYRFLVGIFLVINDEVKTKAQGK